VSVASDSLVTLAHGSKSFRLASYFLPVSARIDAAVIYAFCRHVDDVVDEAPDRESAATALDRVRAQLDGRAEASSLVLAVEEIAQRTGMLRAAALELVEGVGTDLDEVRVADDRGLLRYCYGVASTVGLMMCGVLGVRDRVAHAFAVDLGVAMQLTNICRDVAADAAMGRVYLPASRIEANGVHASELLEGRAPPEAVARVVSDLLELADRYYRSAFAGMRYIPFRTRTAIVIAARLYRQIGVKLRRNGCNALAGRTVVGPIEKLVTLAGALVRCLDPRLLGFLPARAHERELHAALAGLSGAST
jgi:phytoene synthase